MLKNMKSNKVKGVVLGGLGLALAGTLCVGGAMAYLTDTDTATNTFTVGEVTIDTIEPNYPGNGSDETIDLVPNEEVKKDPQIKNTGKNRAIVYQWVDIPMANVITAQDDGTRNPQANTELFGYRTAEGEYNSTDAEWILLDTDYLTADDKDASKDNAVKVRRLYGYSNVLDEDETTEPVFDVVRMANVIEGMIDNSTQSIKITSFAIQAENIADLTTPDYDDEMTEEQLNKIWQVYVNQSGDVDPDDADTSNDNTLIETTLNVTMQVDNTHLRLNTGDVKDTMAKATVKLAYTGTGTAPGYTFESSNQQVATVDNDGNIKAVGVGDTVITVSAKNPDTGKTASASVTIQVRDVNAGE